MNPADSGVTVQYTGREINFVERNYGSGLTFDQGQARTVPRELADKLLRHGDVFQRADAEPAPAKGKAKGDDTAAQLAKAAKETAEKDATNNQRQDVVDQVNVMEKDALKEYASIKYGQPLSKSLTLENMRAKVVGFIDQYGLV